MSQRYRGWLLDLYACEAEGVRLWFIGEDDSRASFTHEFPVTFYASGERAELRRLWKQLRGQPGVLGLNKAYKQDAFVLDPVETLEIRTADPSQQLKIFQKLEKDFESLTWYDADIMIQTRYMARHGAFPMAFCELEHENGRLISLQVLNSRWDLMPELPPFKTLEMAPDLDPIRHKATKLLLHSAEFSYELPLDPNHNWLRKAAELLEAYDPDFVVTSFGDTWLVPFILKQAEESGIPFAFNRDLSRKVRWQKETSYFSYGHIIYRPEEAHFFGRCHIDRKSAMMWSDYSLAGTLEMARVTAMPIEKAARVSPGQGISAMQVITALEKNMLVPYQKRQVEQFKTGVELIQSDRGGMVYQPKLGVHTDVAQIDFVSMYPAIIIKGNISPEVPLPELLEPAVEELGVVPLTLQPLYNKRVELKKKIKTYHRKHPMAKTLSERATALKWLLVVCFGFLGYKNARYGRIEAHEAVTKGGREVLIRAKEVAEENGFEVLHLFVDALWVKKRGYVKEEDFTPLLEAIHARTGIAIGLDGIYRWVAFMPSKVDERIPIGNRYFGVFQNGDIKVRGIELRRRDTPKWIAAVQQEMISCIGEARSQKELQPQLLKAFIIFEQALKALKSRAVNPEDLVMNGKVSYALDAYKASTASVRAARQMEAAGMAIRPGQRVRFLYTLGEPDVFAWDLGQPFDLRRLDTGKYLTLLAKAGAAVLQPFGLDPKVIIEWGEKGCLNLALPERELQEDQVEAESLLAEQPL